MFSCEEAKYSLDNYFDPANMDLDPPALFFHPDQINTVIDTTIAVELYGYELDPAAAASLDIRYDWGSVTVDSVVPGPFFIGQNNPIEITVDEQGILSIFIYSSVPVMIHSRPKNEKRRIGYISENMYSLNSVNRIVFPFIKLACRGLFFLIFGEV